MPHETGGPRRPPVTAFGAFVLTDRPRHRIGLLFVACYTLSVAYLGLRWPGSRWVIERVLRADL